MPDVDYKTQWYLTKPNYKQFDAESDFWEMTYLDRWRDILSFLPQDKVIEAKVLDIGCGMGRAISYYKRFGANVLGIEPSVYAAEIAKGRGLEVINKYFTDVELFHKFDVVQFEQVLSHMPNYLEAIKKAKDLLTDDGVMLIEEPNDYNEFQLRLEPYVGAYWKTADHANYFNFKSMEEILKSEGLTVVKRTATWPMELFELAGRRYIGDDEAGRKLHEEAANLQKSMGQRLRDKVLMGWAQMDLGRDLVLFARKSC